RLNEFATVFLIGDRRFIEVFIKAAAFQFLTAITSSRSTISAFAAELRIIRAVDSTILSLKLTVSIVLTF
ncbi:hypothetical protein, partial [Erysipelatoclostridium sp. DFI.2.3]|uniref:hypothetical protein n=1 Tax=Bacillota TaxID=1239 RepID=UPI001C38A1BD